MKRNFTVLQKFGKEIIIETLKPKQKKNKQRVLQERKCNHVVLGNSAVSNV